MIQVVNIKDPSFPNFISIIVLMKSHSEWGVLGPYELKDESSAIMENKYQSMKVYEKVPYSCQRKSRWDQTVIWHYSEEVHYKDGKITDEYWNWRKKLMYNKYAVRYPVGFNNMKNCLFAISDDNLEERLDYISARKKIYVPEYIRLVKQHKKFIELKEKLNRGQNLLIIEVDGPHLESLPYYKEKYNINDDFIQRDTMLVNKDNINVMINDGLHPFGHGYCLAIALLDLDYSDYSD